MATSFSACSPPPHPASRLFPHISHFFSAELTEITAGAALRAQCPRRSHSQSHAFYGLLYVSYGLRCRRRLCVYVSTTTASPGLSGNAAQRRAASRECICRMVAHLGRGLGGGRPLAAPGSDKVKNAHTHRCSLPLRLNRNLIIIKIKSRQQAATALTRNRQS